MEKYVITKTAIEHLVKWVINEFGCVKLPPKQKGVSISLVGLRYVDTHVEILVKSGENIPEMMEKLNQKLKVSLEKLAGLELRHSKITVRGLYDESIQNETH